MGYNMFVGYGIGHHRRKGSKTDKRAFRSLNFISITARSSFFELSLGQDLPTGFTKEDKSRFSLGQDLPRRTNFAEDDKLPAE